MENHPDREISTALLSSFSKLPSMRQLETPAGVSAMASAFLNVSYELPTTANGVVGLDFEKGQAGASSAALELLDETSQNPVLHDALGLLLVMYNVPYLPTLPPSSRLLSHLWPRLKQYVFLDSSDSLYAICTSGAAGIEVNASACLDGWLTQRVPALQAQLAVANDTLWRAFPSLDSDGIPLSGSYLNEADYFDPEWQRTQVSGSNLNLSRCREGGAGAFTCNYLYSLSSAATLQLVICPAAHARVVCVLFL